MRISDWSSDVCSSDLTDYRSQVDDIYRIHVKNNKGEMVPIRALAEARLVLGPQALTRYNNYRAAIINGAPAPGHSRGAALAAMERLSATTLPAGYSLERSEERRVGKECVSTCRSRWSPFP